MVGREERIVERAGQIAGRAGGTVVGEQDEQ